MPTDPNTGEQLPYDSTTPVATQQQVDPYEGLTAFEKKLAQGIQDQNRNVSFSTYASDLLSKQKQETQSIYDQIYQGSRGVVYGSDVKDLMRTGERRDIGGGRSVGYDTQSGNWTLYDNGNAIFSSRSRTDFVNQGRDAVLKQMGYDGPKSGQGTYGFLSNAFKNVAQKLGLETSDYKQYKDIDSQRLKANEGNYGTFINAAGKQVVATTPETLKSMQALGFRQVAEGTTQLTPEQQTMVQQGRQQVEQQIQQGLASGQIDAATAQNLMAGQQEGDVGAGMQAQTQPDTPVQMAGMPTQTTQPQMQVNSSTGEITLASGQRISPQDPNYQQYLSQLPTAQGLPSGTQLATGQAQAQPADQQLASQVQQAMQTNAASKANPDYVNAVFKAYHNRDATQEELARYGNMTVAQAGQEIIGGAPQPFTQEEAALVSSGQFQRIESPEQLTQLAAQYGLGEKDIVRIGNKLFAPANLKVDVDGVLDGTTIANREYTGLDNTSDLDTQKVADVANDYYNQYISQVSPDFTETRKEYWKSLLLQTDFRETKLGQLQDEYQLDEISDKLADLDMKIAAENQVWRTLEEENRNQPISITAILGREAHIKRMASIRMEGLLGQREALAGDYDRAMKHIEQAYTAAVGDYEENVENLKSWYEEQKDFFDKQEQRAYDAKIKQAEQDFAIYKQERGVIADVLTTLAEAGIVSDISLNDDYEEAMQKAAALIAANAKTDVSDDMMTSDYKNWALSTNYGANGTSFEQWLDAQGKGAGNTKTQEAIDTASQVKNIATKLLEYDESILNLATGGSAIIANIQGTPAYSFKKDFDQLLSLLTLDNLGIMKGVLSDTDIKILTNAATSLDRGKPTADVIKDLQELSGISGDSTQPSSGLDSIWDFNSDQSTSLNYSPYKSGQVTGYGSKLWKHGLDYVVQGGKGAPVTAPFDGIVVGVYRNASNPTTNPLPNDVGKSQNSGFGNQVKIRRSDGTEVWLSHLDSVNNIKVGQRIGRNQVVGTQGNTGSTYGNTGVHIDITGKKPDGTYYTPQEVQKLLS